MQEDASFNEFDSGACDGGNRPGYLRHHSSPQRNLNNVSLSGGNNLWGQKCAIIVPFSLKSLNLLLQNPPAASQYYLHMEIAVLDVYGIIIIIIIIINSINNN